MERRIYIVSLIPFVDASFKLTKNNSIMAPTSVIQFRVKHEPFAFQRRILGSVEIDMSKLLTLGEDKKGNLTLPLLLRFV